MTYSVALIVAIIFAILLLAAVAGSRRKTPSSLPAFTASSLFNGTERRVFQVLLAVTQKPHVVLAKVRLADLVTGPNRDRAAFRLVSQKHVDFVIYNTQAGTVHCVIEIDGPTHNAASSRRADTVKNHALKTANLVLHRIPAERWKDPAFLRSICNANVGTSESSDGEVADNIHAKTRNRNGRKPVNRELVGERSKSPGI